MQSHDDAASPPQGVTIAGNTYPLVLPRLGDPRLHLASVIMTIHVLGQVSLDFKVSVIHIVAAIGTAFVVELSVTFVRERAIVWPASAMLTGSGVALILRLPDAEANQPWATQGWQYFAAIAGLSLVSKYMIRYRGAHVFNPSNIVLVAAFVLLGSDRVEPLDFWWAPWGPAMAVAYGAILVGGVAIVARLGLLGLAAGFWVTLTAALGVLSLSGHCFTALWSVTPVCDTHFWWVVVTSPETLVFVFFMITDPRTVPAGPRSRFAFGCAVALVSALLIAPQSTEFGAKVGLLSGLAICSVARLGVRVLADLRPSAIITWRSTIEGWPTATVAALAVPTLAAALVWAGSSAREVDRIDAAEVPAVPALITTTDREHTPFVTATDEAVDFAARNGVEPADLATRVLRLLDIEAEGLRLRDPDLIRAVTHGQRRATTLELLESGVEASNYRFETMHLVLVRRGQVGVRLGFEVSGTVWSDSAARSDVTPHQQQFSALYVVVGIAGDRWVLVDELQPATG